MPGGGEGLLTFELKVEGHYMYRKHLELSAALLEPRALLYNHMTLTLIGPGEVKVDLADFDLKLQENLLSTEYFF
jgi:hypothetical protein